MTAWTPRLMQAADAARYLGVSRTKLLTLGLPRKVCGANRLYDVRDLDAYADSLPREGADDEARRRCDEAFG